MAPGGVACAHMCEAEGEHLHQGLLHRPSHFCVHVRDANGQRLRKGGDRLRVTSRGPGQLRPSVKDVGNGRYDVSYLATLSGSYQLAITCNNAPVRGSPFSLLIEPGVHKRAGTRGWTSGGRCWGSAALRPKLHIHRIPF